MAISGLYKRGRRNARKLTVDELKSLSSIMEGEVLNVIKNIIKSHMHPDFSVKKNLNMCGKLDSLRRSKSWTD
jgi:hypothetical protein